ncbi:MAG: MFS transporter [bacterium]|nr:MFS transporter [bacterium]MDE0602666.1 MFS transporter [bacterium]
MKPRATDLEFNAVRHRPAYVLFSASVLNWAAFVATVTVVTLAARALSGSNMLAGLPLAAGAFGQALGTNLFGGLSDRYGRRLIMLKGPLVSAVGATLELAALMAKNYWLLVGGAMLVGAGVGAVHLSRYTSAELAESERRGWALGLAVWAGTLGSLVGANLVDWVGRLVERGLDTPYGGAFVVAIACFLVCWLLLWSALPLDSSLVAVTTRSGSPGRRRAGIGLGLPAVQVAVLVLLAAQATMVLVMTATPLHIEDTDYDLKVVGLVISALAVGMFAFAPLVGRLVDIIGHLPALGLGVMVTWYSVFLSGTAPYDGYFPLIAGLFLLGLGWCSCIVAGSSMLFSAAPADVRRVLGGVVDWASWTTVMLGSVGAGVLMSGVGYRWLNLVAAVPMLVVLLLVLAIPRFRTALSA